MRTAGVLLSVLFVLPVHAAPCVSESGPNTAALVELYTSEGCSSCPPAERWLGTLPERYPGTAVVPLALHVDYWDYIGWKDSYAKREFALRQKKLSQLQRMALVYTPQVMLQGRDFRRWGTQAFDEAVARINSQPAKARLKLSLLRVDERALEVEVTAELASPARDAALYLASYQSRLQNKVTAGENRGRILTHDHVVLEWLGPLEVQNRRVERRTLPLLPDAAAANSGAAAFVQERRTGEVLQALLRSSC
jgi:hypothetical protein